MGLWVALAQALLVASALWLLLVSVAQADDDTTLLLVMRATYYVDAEQPTYSGVWPARGVAACSWNIPIGTKLRLTVDGRMVTCLDRGRLGDTGWVDIFVPNRREGIEIAKTYGGWTLVEVVRCR